MAAVLRKYELEGKLGEESAMIKSGILRDENPLDTSPEFIAFLEACRHGNLKKCQELINLGVNINGKDRFDYTPLIIASLCGHFELVRLLLESGALAERNTFQGERCIYNALNDRIRNLLLQYDFSKSSDPYVYWSSHISTLLYRTNPDTSDISLIAGSNSFKLHKFLLASRTPYFRSKLDVQPETVLWKLSSTIPAEAFQIVARYIYLGDLPRDLVQPGSRVSEEDVLKALDKISKDLEVEQLWQAIMDSGDRRLARQRYQDEVERAMGQVKDFFERSVLRHKMLVDTDRVNEVKWKHDNSIFADVLLRADEPLDELSENDDSTSHHHHQTNGQIIPIGSSSTVPSSQPKKTRKSALFPAHKAMLIRSEYFDKMFSGDFVESQRSENLLIVTIDCAPNVLELILTFLYTENTNCPLDLALDLLYAADMLFLDNLKTKAAQAISTLGSGNTVKSAGSQPNQPQNPKTARENETREEAEVEPVNIYDVIHAAWDLRVQRLEEFAARYLADRLEDYIDDPDFQELIKESAGRLQRREETDTIELLDDIRYYLSERFRLRFEDAGLEEIMDEDGEFNAEMVATLAAGNDPTGASEPTPGGIDDTGKVGETGGVPVGENIAENEMEGGVTTLDGETAEDEFASDAINYQILLGKVDAMLDRLKLDA